MQPTMIQLRNGKEYRRDSEGHWFRSRDGSRVIQRAMIAYLNGSVDLLNAGVVALPIPGLEDLLQ